MGAIPGAINIRLGDLRSRLGELDKARTYVTCCAVGLRGYLAERILKQNGFKAYNLSGGWATWRMFHPAEETRPRLEVKVNNGGRSHSPTPPQNSNSVSTLDLRQLPCPGPVVQLKAAFKDAAEGVSFRVLADATFEGDLKRWCAANDCAISDLSKPGGELSATLTKGSPSALHLHLSPTPSPYTYTSHLHLLSTPTPSPYTYIPTAFSTISRTISSIGFPSFFAIISRFA